MARPDTPLRALYREAAWIRHLRSNGYAFPVRFNIPRILDFRGSPVFRLSHLPAGARDASKLHPEQYAIGFTAHGDYFAYPNEPGNGKQLGPEEFMDVMLRNAWLLGKLTSLGLVHDAPVPVFHNRVQSFRRADSGLYEWQRAGRLDRWLESCRHPNFGLTGIRDFEHFIPFNGRSRDLYRQIGTHFLSLFLVTGSYFRHKDRGRVGFDGEDRPVDARDLFDMPLLEALIQNMFFQYYHGFVGHAFSGPLPFESHRLAERMVEEMGVDRHMEEILRATDQQQMTDEEFAYFLQRRGYPQKKTMPLQRGKEDIVVYTGPHLGGFNQGISLPECIEFLQSMCALCIFGRYWQENNGMCGSGAAGLRA
jgi:hypothetical protein